jgi:hypothetical protein
MSTLARRGLVVALMVGAGWLAAGRLGGEPTRSAALAEAAVVAEAPDPWPAVEAPAPAARPAAPAPEVSLAAALPPRAPRGRPAGEWQGMQLEPGDSFPCLDDPAASLYGFCALARACVDGQCVGCQADDDCGAGEACALDHCVPAAQVECRRAADCTEPEAQCVLSGLTAGDPRGNRELRAFCLAPSGGQDS